MAEKKVMKEKFRPKGSPYLKFPKKVRDTHGNPKDYPEPEDVTAEVEGNQLEITYKFNLDNFKKKKEVK